MELCCNEVHPLFYLLGQVQKRVHIAEDDEWKENCWNDSSTPHAGAYGPRISAKFGELYKLKPSRSENEELYRIIVAVARSSGVML